MAGSISAASGRIFMSYRREETAYPAGWLYDRLSDRYGAGQVFKDIDSIELGDDFVDKITSAVGSCDVLLTLIGDEWLTITDAHGQRRLDDPDDFVRLEIEAALTRNVRVIPILVDGATMPRADEVPASLAKLVRRQALELSPSRFDFDLSRLLEVLDRTLAEVQDDAASMRESAGRSPDRATELPKTSENREQTEPSSTPSISPAASAAPPGPSPSDAGRPEEKGRRQAQPSVVIAAGSEEEGVPGPAARRWLRGWRGAAAVALAAVVLLVAGMLIWGGDRGAETPPDGAPPGQDASVLLASFETGTEGWAAEPAQPDNGTTSQASDFHTEGSSSLRVDSAGLPERGWYGTSFDPPVDISGKNSVSLDIQTIGVGTQEAIAVQFAPPDYTWCQSLDWGSAGPGTDATVTLDFDNMDCVGSPLPSASDRTKLTAVWVWLDGEGSFRVDNVRAE